jgi:hypothetical protein
MKRSGLFRSLALLLIVIGLAGCAGTYLKSKLKDEISMKILGGIYDMETNIGSLYQSQNKLTSNIDDVLYEVDPRYLRYITASVKDGVITIIINDENHESKYIYKHNGEVTTCTPVIENGKINQWKIDGFIAEIFGW